MGLENDPRPRKDRAIWDIVGWASRAIPETVWFLKDPIGTLRKTELADEVRFVQGCALLPVGVALLSLKEIRETVADLHACRTSDDPLDTIVE